MSILNIEAFREKAANDPEFKHAMRYFSGNIKLGVGDEEFVLSFADGKQIDAPATPVPESACQIIVKGEEEHWTNMLARFPKPFYQSLQSTAVKHGLRMSDTNETFAYLPALNRMMQLMRDIASGS